MAQPQGHMGTQHKLKDIGSHTLKSLFQVKGVVVNYRIGRKKTIEKKIVLHLKNTLARSPI